jgi:ATP:cob(I)alamin adenosyltransferase
MKIYTKAGDHGTTNLMNIQHVSKDDDRINLLGNIDELTSNIGLAKAVETSNNIKLELERIQKNLMKIMASIADQYNTEYNLSEAEIAHLEEEIDRLENSFSRRKEFILPGDCVESARFDVIRTITRRTERSLVVVDKQYAVDSGAKKYVNRLSDYFYILARYNDFKNANNSCTITADMNSGITQEELVKAIVKELQRW